MDGWWKAWGGVPDGDRGGGSCLVKVGTWGGGGVHNRTLTKGGGRGRVEMGERAGGNGMKGPNRRGKGVGGGGGPHIVAPNTKPSHEHQISALRTWYIDSWCHPACKWCC